MAATITAALVGQLREKTGAGMMDAKKALTEADGDMDKAIQILRERRVVQAGKREGRAAAEGLILARISDSKRVGAIIELNSETDFVARNPEFGALGQQIADKVLAYAPGTVPTDLDALLADTMNGGTTVAETLTEAAARIGEKIVLSRFRRFGAPDGNAVAAYVHNPGGGGDDGGKIGVLVETTGADANTLASLAREIALHIASANPQYLSESDVEPGILDKEREIARAQATNDPKMAGKPEKAIESMVNGRVRKFLEETVLLNQAYVRDPAKTIAALVNETPGAGVVRFVRFRVGEMQADAAEESAA